MAQFCCACSPQSSPLTFIPKSSSNFRAFTFSATRLLYIRTPSRRPLSLTATLATVHSAEASGVDSGDKKLLLEVKDLTAVIAESKQKILKGVNLVIYEGEVRNSLLHRLIVHSFPSVWLLRKASEKEKNLAGVIFLLPIFNSSTLGLDNCSFLMHILGLFGQDIFVFLIDFHCCWLDRNCSIFSGNILCVWVSLFLVWTQEIILNFTAK